MSILECKGLSKRFGAVTALDGISFTIEPGRIVGLLGPNGSGKTTLIKLANGLLVPTAGELWINGRAPGKESHAMVSYLPERTSLPLWMTVKQLQDFYEDFYADFQRERSEEMLDRLEYLRQAADEAHVQGHPGKGAADPGHEPPGQALPAG